MKIKPFGERVTIKLVQEDQYTESGLLVATKTASNKGIIEDIGEEVKANLNIGDTVIFTVGAGVGYTDGSQDHRIIGIKDILGKVIGE